jgi:hypothetical protein
MLRRIPHQICLNLLFPAQAWPWYTSDLQHGRTDTWVSKYPEFYAYFRSAGKFITKRNVLKKDDPENLFSQKIPSLYKSCSLGLTFFQGIFSEIFLHI